jgi:hypothetical protein
MSHLPTARGFQVASFKVQDARSEFQWWYILKLKRISREGREGGQVRKDHFPSSLTSRDISDNATTQISGFRSSAPLCVPGVLAVQSRF